MTQRRDSRRRERPPTRALEAAIARGDWERIALHTFVSIAEMLRIEPAATIDDLLALLESPEARDDG